MTDKPNAREKIVITGMGAVAPIGIGVENFWQALLRGECGIADITGIDASALPVTRAAEVKNFNPKDYLSVRQATDLDLFMQFAYIAAEEAIRASGIDTRSNRVGIVMGTAIGGMTSIWREHTELLTIAKPVSPRFVSRSLGNTPAAYISIEYGITGPSLTVSTACSSGGDAITTAYLLLRAGMADAVLVMAGDSAINPMFIHSLYKAKALSKGGDSRPFDVDRDGFVIGEGGSAVILETERHALARNAKIEAELAGCATASDAFHPVSPAPDGAGAAECMRRALENAGLQPSDIDYINAHGTATLKGDIAESMAIGKVFGDYRVLVSSTKGATGHMMGPGGVLEVIACIKAIQTGELPYTIGCAEQDTGCDINLITGAPLQKKIDVAMSNAFGFGGQNSSIIIRRYTD
jgi:3-oxoacyl-[acyl-carrier-protein] synthase II